MKPQRHRRTVTRFCDEAGLEEVDQLDLAEFIVAARYIGTNATDEQLMNTFVEMELAGEDTTIAPKEKIKQLMVQVEQKYGIDESGALDTKEDPGDHEVVALSSPQMKEIAEDAEWQEIQLSGLFGGNDDRLKIAKNLLLTTSLTAAQVADITGVQESLLDDVESDSDFDSDDDDDTEYSTTVVSQSVAPPQASVVINAEKFNKQLVLTQSDMAALDRFIKGGIDAVNQDIEVALILLKKLKAAVTLTPAGMKKAKTMRRLIAKETTGTAAAPSGTATESPAPAKFPAKYRVVISPGALVKSGEELESKEVAKIPIGTVVVVEKISGRRACITSPVNGWCSVVSKDERVILQKENTKTPEMEKAVNAARSRQTKLLILKSITTLNDATVQRILEKSDWNLRRAIEAFYIAKYKTEEYIKQQDGQSSLSAPSGKKAGFFSKWKKFVRQNA